MLLLLTLQKHWTRWAGQDYGSFWNDSAVPPSSYRWWSSCMRIPTRPDQTQRCPVRALPHLQRRKAGLCPGTDSLQDLLQHDAQTSNCGLGWWRGGVRQVPSGWQSLQSTMPQSPHQDAGEAYPRPSLRRWRCPCSPHRASPSTRHMLLCRCLAAVWPGSQSPLYIHLCIAPVHTLCGLRESLRFGTQRKLMEHHEKLWDILQDGESDSIHKWGLRVRSYWRKWEIRLVQDQVWSKAGMYDVRILVLAGPGLDHEEGNNRQEKRDMVEFRNSVGGPGFRRRHCPADIQV